MRAFLCRQVPRDNDLVGDVPVSGLDESAAECFPAAGVSDRVEDAVFAFSAAEEEPDFVDEFVGGEGVAWLDALSAALFFFGGAVGVGAGFAGCLVGALVASVGCGGAAGLEFERVRARLAGFVFAFVAAAGLCGAAWCWFAAARGGDVVGGAVGCCPGSLVFTVRGGAGRAPAPAFVGGACPTRLHRPRNRLTRLTGLSPAAVPGLSRFRAAWGNWCMTTHLVFLSLACC